jgi:predicted amidophosphoribosyltransferase
MEFNGTSRPFRFTSVDLCFLGLILPSAILPTVVLYRLARSLVSAPHDGHCSGCGYNLTGNTSGVCPECGAPVTKEVAEKSPRPLNRRSCTGER